MNKATKGAVAAGAAALLLAGGAGTMAAWNANAPMTGGTITAGHLTLSADPSALPSWTVTNGATTETNVDIASYRVSPGDKITYTSKVKVGIDGKNLKAQVVADTTTITGSLATALTTTTSTTLAGQPLTQLTEANDGTTVDVVVTFDFPKGTVLPDNTANNASQDQTASLANFNVKLEQV
ncbi:MULTISPECIES: alternate-type signal peptide domain-containing protein [unclassified Rhodococcus (in: high G+C Gram-positive bacteria)]|uniref:alternate-type signal peptide domain-containing protein n=1 Tax=unclassified Rhodococcus (in: high G+C Gram-positive bacteria) TaxID=192944 RepID=UPI0024B746F4|nr:MULTISPECIES: alternate-type signal peptide domain-containing protein [unclassified Rhodococcus (in: high G+C Gram-positive bacteria)]MDI9955315.1 alternate-type signal peptide domain-containing protein [Rhodococcus sp. IEGM 1237]MDI9961336.1 alternate-type signal peptide domain-containing protein [Rhodococcus sp. IEGM 1251]MDV8123380.1 alternate-type signal peptide domain-containing protein [Rhodococcus sp. IEGM 1304]